MLPMTLGYQGAHGQSHEECVGHDMDKKPAREEYLGFEKTAGVPLWPPQGNKETKEWLCRWTHSRLTYLASQGLVPYL